MTMPAEQVADAHKLNADALIDLFHIILNDGSHLYLKPDNDVVWQGHTWEGVGIQLGGSANSSDSSELARPKLVVFNPLGVLSPYVASGKFNRATLLHLRVLKAHLDSNTNIYSQKTWKVAQLNSLSQQSFTYELRGQMDGPNFLTPARMYLPPEFPSVSL